jgi:thiol-disulfide isomerase/thioredoxin
MVIGSLILLAGVALFNPRAAVAEVKIDEESQQVLDAFGKYYAELKGFKVAVNINLTVDRDGTKQNVTFEQKLAAERPNKFSYSYDGQGGGATIVSDGKNFSVFIKPLGKYAVEKAPERLESLFTNPIVMGVLSMGNATPVTASLVSPDPARQLSSTAESIEYGGQEVVDGVKCHHLSATGAQMDWQIWIDAGGTPLVRKFLPDLTKALEAMAKAQGGRSQLAGMKIENVVTYENWEVDPTFGEDAFVFNAPADAEKFDSLMQMFTGGRGGPAAEPEPHALLGKAAPPIDLELLDGGKLDLASYKDKNVVILDFWATWCGPCVRAMPIIDKVAEKYKDKGVLLFAVNIQETPDEIKKFLEETDLAVDVALDTEGETAQAYLASAIPQTVIVGKDGLVQVVKIGVSPDLETSLTDDLESLIAGKDLAAETQAKAKASKDAAAKAQPDTDDTPAKSETKE